MHLWLPLLYLYVGATLTTPVTFTAGPPANTYTTLVASPNANVYASGTQPVTLTLTLADAFGNAASNQNVTWSASAGMNTFAPASSTTDAAGVATTQLTSITAGSRTVQATAGGATVTVMVTFVPGGYAPVSTFTASPNQVAADGNAQVTLTLTARDGNSNRLPGAAVLLLDAVPNRVIVPTSGTTDSNGVFTATMTATQAGVQNVSARFAGGKLDASVIFNPLAANCAATAFYGGPPWPNTGTNSGYGVVTADFNADGNQDFAILRFNGSVQVMLSRGNQLFAAPAAYNVGGASTAIAVGDLNNDGVYDLAERSEQPHRRPARRVERQASRA
jgi:Tfp pilus assembly protein PilV